MVRKIINNNTRIMIYNINVTYTCLGGNFNTKYIFYYI